MPPDRALSAQIRSSITALFPNRDCFALVRPMSDERALQHLESIPGAQLRPEFREARPGLTVMCDIIRQQNSLPCGRLA